MKYKKIISIALICVIFSVIIMPTASATSLNSSFLEKICCNDLTKPPCDDYSNVILSTPACIICKEPNAYSTATNHVRHLSIDSSSRCFQREVLYSLQCKKNGCGHQWQIWVPSQSGSEAHVMVVISTNGLVLTLRCSNINQGVRCPRTMQIIPQ